MMVLCFLLNTLAARYLQLPGKPKCYVEELNKAIKYFFNQNTWTSGIINLFLSQVKGSSKTVSCDNNLFVKNRSANVHNRETWQERTHFSQSTPPPAPPPPPSALAASVESNLILVSAFHRIQFFAIVSIAFQWSWYCGTTRFDKISSL